MSNNRYIEIAFEALKARGLVHGDLTDHEFHLDNETFISLEARTNGEFLSSSHLAVDGKIPESHRLGEIFCSIVDENYKKGINFDPISGEIINKKPGFDLNRHDQESHSIDYYKFQLVKDFFNDFEVVLERSGFRDGNFNGGNPVVFNRFRIEYQSLPSKLSLPNLFTMGICMAADFTYLNPEFRNSIGIDFLNLNREGLLAYGKSKGELIISRPEDFDMLKQFPEEAIEHFADFTKQLYDNITSS